MRDGHHHPGGHPGATSGRPSRDPAALPPFGSGHYGSNPPQLRKEPDRGKKVLFLILAVAVIWTLLLAGVAGQYGADMWGALDTHKKNRAETMLKETVKALGAYSFENLPKMNGTSVHQASTPEHSDFKVEIAVTPSASGLLKVRAVLTDTKTRRKLTQMVTYRGRS